MGILLVFVDLRMFCTFVYFVGCLFCLICVLDLVVCVGLYCCGLIDLSFVIWGFGSFGSNLALISCCFVDVCFACFGLF